MVFKITKTILICSSLLAMQVFAQNFGAEPVGSSLTLRPRNLGSGLNWNSASEPKGSVLFKIKPLPAWNPPPIPKFGPTNFNVGAFSDFCDTPKDDFIKLISKMESVSCYENNKNSDPLSLDANSTNLSLVLEDVATCRCLYRKAETNVSLYAMNFSKFKKVAIEIDEGIEHVNRIQENLSANISAVFIANLTNDADAVARHNAAGSMTGGIGGITMRKGVRAIQKDLGATTLAKFSEASNTQDASSASEADPDENTIPGTEKSIQEINENYLNSSVAEGHCISGREYALFKSLPQDDLFFKELSHNSFKPEEWSYPELRNRYNAIMTLSGEDRAQYREEILKLKSKIFYLDSNPLIKSVFAAEESPVTNEMIKQIENPEAQNLAYKSMSAPQILKSKTELYKILQEYADVRKKCFGKPGECLEQASKNGKTAKLFSEMKTFFERPDVEVMHNFDQSHTKILVNKENPSSKPENWTREGIISYFKENNPTLASPSSCLRKNSIDTQKCSKIFAEYCPVVESAHKKMSFFNMDDALKDDVDLRLSSIFDIKNLEKNEEFQKLNEEICKTPRKVNPNDEKAVTFFDFKKEYCAGNPQPSECKSKDSSDIQKIRTLYMEKFKHPLSSNALAFNDVSSQVEIKNVKVEDVIRKQQTITNFEDLFDFSHFSGANLATVKPKAEKSFLTGLAEYTNEKNRQNDSSNSEVVSNYVSNFDSSAVQSQLPQEAKVENLSDAQRSNLLDDWKQELSNFKKEQTTSSNSEAYKLREEALNEKIATLEALLAQQKKLSESQYKLLNDAIAAQSQRDQEEAESTSDVVEGKKSSQRKSQSYAQADHAFNEGTGRLPASVKDYQNDLGGNTTNGPGSAALGRNRSGNSALADGGASSDSSVERESAKLVRLRQNSNGSITIETKSSAGLSPNAIAVPISDDLYKMVQMNPTGLNLFQIEKNIPKEQIAELEKKDYIILLLQNGSNPPLEVKVRKENNKLVQVKDTQVVVRSVSLQSLQNTLRQ